MERRDAVKRRVEAEDMEEKGAEEERSRGAAEAMLWGLVASAAVAPAMIKAGGR